MYNKLINKSIKQININQNTNFSDKFTGFYKNIFENNYTLNKQRR